MDGRGGQGGAEEDDFAWGNKRILPVPPLITQPSSFDAVLERVKGSAGSGTGLSSLGLGVLRTADHCVLISVPGSIPVLSTGVADTPGRVPVRDGAQQFDHVRGLVRRILIIVFLFRYQNLYRC